MKKDIHPQYKEATVTCACGNVIHTRSTRSDIRVEICSSCHPFFTGKQKLVDTAGRVERFRRKYGLEESSADMPAEETTAGAAVEKKTAGEEPSGKETDAGQTAERTEQADTSAGEQVDESSVQKESDDR